MTPGDLNSLLITYINLITGTVLGAGRYSSEQNRLVPLLVYGAYSSWDSQTKK